MTCKDCVHYDACADWIPPDELLQAIKACDKYKNKVEFVEVVRCSECRFNVANMEKDGYDTTDYSGNDIVCL